MFRVSRGQAGYDADTVEQARDLLRGENPGRHHADEIRAEPSLAGHTSRAWGRLILRPDGRVEDEPHPWEE
jgi:hypothetical protein